ncbi:MarR family winged helix-turn-helix transcriptional regulator [Jannaschia sp. W003]|uniref:MarR family winged helix-turn-helix transcriptional regulator n=1 Tax=Jannaschia sp. W003 TaxID=2867012 RepID=UPI0021A8C2AC|nr:MarR family winged helix-turn-helix transcriptional regulator [Jannaschia sp. W003]UWQ20169.1 MarR family winged helix-turn-helix transcriptional regulator [Jannaschia sp. W003]
MSEAAHHLPETIAKLTSFVTFRLSRTQSKLTAHTTNLLRAHSDMTVAEWRLMRLLDAGGPTTMATLARQVQMDKGQLSRKIKGLAARGLVELRPDPRDSRRQVLRITPEGSATIERLVPVIRRRQELLTRDISPEDMKVFMRVLAQLDEASDHGEVPDPDDH